MSTPDARAAGDLSERDESLWLVAAPPLVWAAHFLLSYCTAAVWCAKAAGPGVLLGPVRPVIAAYTAAALAAIAWIGWRGWKRHTLRRPVDLPHEEDTPEDRHRFLGFVTMLLAGLSGVAVVYEALAAVFVEACW